MPVERDLGISNPALEQKGMGTLGPRAFSKICLSILTLKRNLHICIYVYVIYIHTYVYLLKEKEILSSKLRLNTEYALGVKHEHFYSFNDLISFS